VPLSLSQTGDKRAIPPLIAALDNGDPSERVMVIRAGAAQCEGAVSRRSAQGR
jgi:HEAT repeat protein